MYKLNMDRPLQYFKTILNLTIGITEKRAAEESEATEATSPTKKAKVQEETTEAAAETTA